MTECEECIRLGYSKTDQIVYSCALCGELRCEDHAIWVPAHELEKPVEGAKKALEFVKGSRHGGWYVFCGRPSHIPRGVPIRHGEARVGGKVVAPILDHEKKKGLEFFRMWEVGIVEEGIEKRWEPKSFALSCSLAPAMALAAHLFLKEANPNEYMRKVYDSAIQVFASKKSIFSKISFDEFQKISGKAPKLEDIAKLICSRCRVVVCVNREENYYDKKEFKNLIKNPEILEMA
ncbi:MAG: hypothetical protein ACXADL_04315 [Candidatus Thorarchaeota archaeon]|jgi:hypothetical protein